MADVRTLCEHVLLLDKGCVVKQGQPDTVVDYYNAMASDAQSPKQLAAAVLRTLQDAVAEGKGDSFVPELVSILGRAP